MLPVELPLAAQVPNRKRLADDTGNRGAHAAQIALLIYVMTNGVLFGAGVILVLTWPTLSVDAGFWISAVVATSFILAAPIAWWIAPRMRARYWRRRMNADHASQVGSATSQL